MQKTCGKIKACGCADRRIQSEFISKEEASSPRKLSEEEADQFHRSVAQLMFLSKRARSDVQTVVAFLCTQTQHPDVDIAKKLGCVIQHLQETIFHPLVLG